MNTTGSSKPLFDQAFKDQAVELGIESGRPLKAVARELGVSDTSLREWKQKYLERIGTRESEDHAGKPARGESAPATGDRIS